RMLIAASAFFAALVPVARTKGNSARRVMPATRSSSQSKLRNDRDRKSTRLNSSHLVISYAVFCLKKKKNKDSLRQRTSLTPYGLCRRTLSRGVARRPSHVGCVAASHSQQTLFHSATH